MYNHHNPKPWIGKVDQRFQFVDAQVTNVSRVKKAIDDKACHWALGAGRSDRGMDQQGKTCW